MYTLIHGRIIKNRPFCYLKWVIRLNLIKFCHRLNIFATKVVFRHFVSFHQKQNPLECML